MNGKWRKVFFISVLIIFCLGFGNWLTAYFYEPSLPEPERVRNFKYNQKEAEFPLARYQILLDGSLFFGKPVLSVKEEKPFTSKLTLWGIIFGKAKRAVVGVDSLDPADTVIVKPGDRIAGEYIKTIGRDFIVVRNQSGEGKIFIKE